MAGTRAEGDAAGASPSGRAATTTGHASGGGDTTAAASPPPATPPPPPKPDVHWTALDDMVLDYLAQEGCIEPVPAPAARNAAKRAAAETVRSAIIAGDIPRALEAAYAAHPALLGPPHGPPPKPPPSDERLRFRLERQHVLDLLRGGGTAAERRAAALEALRTRLAPRAAGAAPDEFPAFRATLLALVCDPPPAGGASKPPSGAPTTAKASTLPPPDVAALWSDTSRAALAGLAARSVRAAARWVPPRLEAAVRYLALAQRAAGGRRPLDVASLEALAGGARDGRPLAPPPPPLEEEGGGEGGGHTEWPPLATAATATPADITTIEGDVQRLRIALVLPREEAAAALRDAGGRGRNGALVDELGALTGGRALLTGLAAEYAAVRGLVDGPWTKAGSPGSPRPRWTEGAAPACAAPAAAASRLAAAAAAGDADAVEASLEASCPGLLARRPDVAFALLRARFAALASAGDALGALSLARTRLAPLAAGNPALHDDIKAAVAGLLPASHSQQQEDDDMGGRGKASPEGGGAAGTPCAPPAWPGGLDPALGAAIADAAGAPLYPRLAVLIASLLDAHALWSSVQRLIQDVFSSAAGVNALRPPGWSLAAAVQRAEATAGRPAAGSPTIVGGAQPRGGHGDPRIARGGPEEIPAHHRDLYEAAARSGDVAMMRAIRAAADLVRAEEPGARSAAAVALEHALADSGDPAPSDTDGGGHTMSEDDDDGVVDDDDDGEGRPMPTSSDDDDGPPPPRGGGRNGGNGGGGGPPLDEEAVTLVMEFTGLSREAAIDSLNAHGWEAQAAVAAMFN